MMNQQNQGPGSASTVPMKRKRGRPRKEESVVQGENKPVMLGSDNVLNSYQTVGTNGDCDDEMVGKMVTGVIEGTFKAGYLLNVKVADTDAFLRGLVFLPGQVAPITAESDVAPHIQMIKRKETPIPVQTAQAAMHGSVPSSVQCSSKQPFQPELFVPVSKEQVLPTMIHYGNSVSLENQPASATLPKNQTSITCGGIPQGMLEPVHENRSYSIMSKLECDKAMEQDEMLNELDDEGAKKDSKPASEHVPTIVNTGQQTVVYVHKLNDLIQQEPNTLPIELNQIPLTSEPESMPSEQINKSVDYFVEKPKTNVLDDTKTVLAMDTLSKVDTSNSNRIPSFDAANNILDVGSNHDALETFQPQSIPFEQISKSVPSESNLPSEGCNFQEKSEFQKCFTFGDLNKVDVNQPNESLVNPVESENQIESNIS
ncbi:PREDICTED: uncharacterized protein LOC109352864 isoform X2 [Lupinus angustifolius]|uniref:uncharacterized protein LOC109352864 isoform X2 n=1 Tax=Lupinus angustifolius TaxID=3871 RepID=UPI00092E39C0|nr:PREDICTED: uncharacterized protein LOC109352864 isoform X2 [Lupinus angustifolius]